MQTGGAARRVLERLRSRGVRIAIDEFGTGYSSLQYLGRLPLDVIKIDRSFAAGLPGDKAAAGVIGAVTGLARSLRARTVAEGIETAAQYASVVAHGCDEGQGFLFARPLEAPEFAAWCVAGVDAAARTALQAAR